LLDPRQRLLHFLRRRAAGIAIEDLMTHGHRHLVVADTQQLPIGVELAGGLGLLGLRCILLRRGLIAR
jgi:hypothetical protein